MRIKLVLVLFAFFTHSVSTKAQTAIEFSANDIFSIQSRKSAPLPTKGLFQSNGDTFNNLNKSNNPGFKNVLSNNSSGNCDDSNAVFAPDAAPCNGASVTSINFLNSARTVSSGTDNTVGVIYRYSNVGTAPDGAVLDALVTVTNYSNNQDATPNTFRSADLYLNPDNGNAIVGFENNLQPSLEPETNVLPNAVAWSGSITYRIQFVLTGTNTLKRISVAATTLDNDGSAICGGLRESVTYSSSLNQTLTSASTNQTQNANSFTGPQAVQPGIGTGIDYANAALFLNVTEISWTYSFLTNSVCAANSASEDRFGSLNLSCQINFNRNFPSVALSGTVFNDANGLTDSTVNGTGINIGGTLFANLLDSSNNVVSSVAVQSNGTYSFPTTIGGSYTIQLSNTQGIESSPAPAATLPFGWVNTGENLGAGAGNDGIPANGLLAVTVGTTAVTNANFGIEQRPTASASTAATQTNPGGTNSATVPTSVFTATDTAPGTVSSTRITSFPSNATSLTVGTTTYYSTTLPGTCPTATCLLFPTVAGVTVSTNTSGVPTQTILVDPTANGATTVGISYVAVDNAGVESSAPVIASVPFVNVSISGTVFNDANGLTDATVNGTGTNAGGLLYANLLNNSNNVLQSILVAADGTYTFANLNSGSYSVQISTNQGTVGVAAPVTALPSGWVNTGENIGTTPGSDGTANSLLAVVVGSTGTNVIGANFGIEQRPTANNGSVTNRANPNGTVSAPVSAAAFTASDPSPGVISSIRIKTFPTNATSFTVGTTTYYATAAAIPGTCPTATCASFAVAGPVTISAGTNGNPAQAISVDPINGPVTVAIAYFAVDNAGVESEAAKTVSVPFTLGTTAANGNVSGVLYFEGAPLPNTLVLLIDSNTNARTFTRTDVNGKYLFEDQNVGRTYVVQPLSSKYAFSPAASVVSLLDNALGLNFESEAKTYRPKNDFDGDGKTDIAVFRPSDGNWFVLRSSDSKFSAFQFGFETDLPVSADFDGDGKTDCAVYRPTEGNWYIWQSATQNLRVEQFGTATDKLVPADYDGDGKTDIAVYRNGVWYVRRSSDNTLEAKTYGASTDTPLTGDFDGDGKSDLTVFRPNENVWYTLRSSNNASIARQFGLTTDVSATGDFDGDGMADIVQFRNGNWYKLNSTIGFEASQLGTGEDSLSMGDYDGDGRADTAIFRNGLWSIRHSRNGTLRNVYFGLPTDLLIK